METFEEMVSKICKGRSKSRPYEMKKANTYEQSMRAANRDAPRGENVFQGGNDMLPGEHMLYHEEPVSGPHEIYGAPESKGGISINHIATLSSGDIGRFWAIYRDAKTGRPTPNEADAEIDPKTGRGLRIDKRIRDPNNPDKFISSNIHMTGRQKDQSIYGDLSDPYYQRVLEERENAKLRDKAYWNLAKKYYNLLINNQDIPADSRFRDAIEFAMDKSGLEPKYDGTKFPSQGEYKFLRSLVDQLYDWDYVRVYNTTIERDPEKYEGIEPLDFPLDTAGHSQDAIYRATIAGKNARRARRGEPPLSEGEMIHVGRILNEEEQARKDKPRYYPKYETRPAFGDDIYEEADEKNRFETGFPLVDKYYNKNYVGTHVTPRQTRSRKEFHDSLKQMEDEYQRMNAAEQNKNVKRLNGITTLSDGADIDQLSRLLDRHNNYLMEYNKARDEYNQLNDARNSYNLGSTDDEIEDSLNRYAAEYNSLLPFRRYNELNGRLKSDRDAIQRIRSELTTEPEYVADMEEYLNQSNKLQTMLDQGQDEEAIVNEKNALAASAARFKEKYGFHPTADAVWSANSRYRNAKRAVVNATKRENAYYDSPGYDRSRDEIEKITKWIEKNHGINPNTPEGKQYIDRAMTRLHNAEDILRNNEARDKAASHRDDMLENVLLHASYLNSHGIPIDSEEGYVDPKFSEMVYGRKSDADRLTSEIYGNRGEKMRVQQQMRENPTYRTSEDYKFRNIPLSQITSARDWYRSEFQKLQKEQAETGMSEKEFNKKKQELVQARDELKAMLQGAREQSVLGGDVVGTQGSSRRDAPGEKGRSQRKRNEEKKNKKEVDSYSTGGQGLIHLGRSLGKGNSIDTPNQTGSQTQIDRAKHEQQRRNEQGIGVFEDDRKKSKQDALTIAGVLGSPQADIARFEGEKRSKEIADLAVEVDRGSGIDMATDSTFKPIPKYKPENKGDDVEKTEKSMDVPDMSLKDMFAAISKSEKKDGHPYGKPIQGNVFAYGSTQSVMGQEKDAPMPDKIPAGETNGEGVKSKKLDL